MEFVENMIDLRHRLNESVTKVRFYGSWLTYGGLVVIIAALITFIIEFMRMMHIARMPTLKSGREADVEQLEMQLDKLEHENQE